MCMEALPARPQAALESSLYRAELSVDQDDPYTLVVALDSKGCAEGDLYVDDGKSFAFERGVFAHRHFRCCPAVPDYTRIPSLDASRAAAVLTSIC